MFRLFKRRSSEENRDDLLKRNTRWAMLFTELMVKQPDLALHLPQDATVLILPQNDPELCKHNLRLADSRDGEVVLVELRVERRDHRETVHVRPFLGQSRFSYDRHVP
jgi:hypothetical protein